ncbi:Site-specific recombinase XerD [Kaistia soli DSM 19436]|uniref:Site-specific recombinase XerD n=1 Tax=Kaistia soli DSM 19436 TaxID=1122133 RepID=A0A1M4Y4P6_9HYPH|nr:site-specific integrase [Kaistia soli]SHF00731.1 Site-specific recombinase XerD [Kaistia soli DSM 19436]
MPLDIVARKGSPYWYLRGTVRGKAVYETTGTRDRAAAEAIRITTEKDILDRSVYGDRAVATFIEAANAYLDTGRSMRFVGERDAATGKWSGLIGHFGSKRLATITQADLDNAARKLVSADAKPETRNRQVYTPFIAIWRDAAKRGLCDPREWIRPKMTAPPRDRWATKQEVERMVGAASPHLAPLVTFLALTGARMAEALELEWADVDLSAGWCVFRITKRGEPRGVPLHPSAIVALANLSHREGRVFRTHKGEPYYDAERLAGGQTKTAWRGMCKRAKVVGVTPHTLRHTFSTWLTVAGVSERVRDELMGHASASIGRRYAHVPREEMISAVHKLPHLATKSVHSRPIVKRKKSINKAVA